ncbi:phosphotyrosine protein phosphatase I superfamily [Geopyxis carbonaria]|nr:phosphotyrosine protein phosphatase I superfamily [Geopyxis carbonaria]
MTTPAPDKKISVLFCCLGNICRSPMAESAFRHTITSLSLGAHIDHIDSCGTASYHTGDSPDPRTVSTLLSHGIKTTHRARAVNARDFERFDYILAMDTSNLRDLQRKAAAAGESAKGKAKVMLFGDAGGYKGEVVRDPYYGGDEGFEENFEQVCRFSRGFVERVLGVDVEAAEAAKEEKEGE